MPRSFARVQLGFVACFAVLAAAPSWSRAEEEVTYWKDVRPLLRKSCTVCHNPRQRKETEISGGLTLDSYEAVLKWKEKNRVLVHPGKSGTSPLYQVLVTSEGDKRMPLGATPLPEETIAIFKRWIDSGAKEGTRPESASVVPVSPSPRRRQPREVELKTATPLTLSLQVGPLAPVVALAFHPKQPWLAVGSYGRVTIWDVKQARPVQVLTSVLGAVHDLRFSPEGKLLLVAGGQPSAKGDLRLFGTEDWKLRRVLAGHEDVVGSASFRPDGAKIASASYDRTVRVWDVVTGKSERAWSMHSDFVTSVAWSPDGKYLASGSKDRTVRLIEAETGASRFTFSDRNEDVLAVAYRPDGENVVSTGLEPGLNWWSTDSGAKTRTVNGHRGSVQELAFSPGGKWLSSAGSDGTMRLWNGKTGAMVRTIPIDSLVYATTFSPDGQVVVAGSFDGLVRVFETATGNLRATLLSLSLTEWMVLTPAGYVTGSEDLLSRGNWKQGGKPAPASLVTRLRHQDNVIRSLRGDRVPPLSFQK